MPDCLTTQVFLHCAVVVLHNSSSTEEQTRLRCYAAHYRSQHKKQSKLRHHLEAGYSVCSQPKTMRPILLVAVLRQSYPICACVAQAGTSCMMTMLTMMTTMTMMM
mmetsp:Transcript_56730/g.184625  ORF Transcript_56730/g.184625 Transcript_56730/m.184625 type:complete len:106 (+) Transcript_56730:188-505(+)